MPPSPAVSLNVTPTPGELGVARLYAEAPALQRLAVSSRAPGITAPFKEEPSAVPPRRTTSVAAPGGRRCHNNQRDIEVRGFLSPPSASPPLSPPWSPLITSSAASHVSLTQLHSLDTSAINPPLPPSSSCHSDVCSLETHFLFQHPKWLSVMINRLFSECFGFRRV